MTPLKMQWLDNKMRTRDISAQEIMALGDVPRHSGASSDSRII